MTTSDFQGFPSAGFTFLQQLEQNNKRDWFKAHKQDYLDHLRDPALHFISELGEQLQTLSDDIHYDMRTNGSGSLMRIYRDIRFSKDKTPYKTHVSMVFWEGMGKKMECPGFYVYFDANGGKVYAGMHQFNKPILAAYREAVDDDKMGEELVEVLATVRDAGRYELGGEHYKRVPRGYDAEHPRADLLKYKGLHAMAPTIAPKDLQSPRLVDLAFEHSKNLLSVHRWLVKVAARAED